MSFSIIGEIGVNHNGQLSLAKELVSFLAEAGADFAKIQVFEPALLTSPGARLAEYQSRNGVLSATQLEMLDSLSLSQDSVLELNDYALRVGIKLLATPFDLVSLTFLTSELGHRHVKFASGDITFLRLLWKAARTESQIFLSTGMSTLEEIENALRVIQFGRRQARGEISDSRIPSRTQLTEFGLDKSFQPDREIWALPYCIAPPAIQHLLMS